MEGGEKRNLSEHMTKGSARLGVGKAEEEEDEG